jgi:hypothetical protein
MVFRGILDEFTIASPQGRPRLQQAMRTAILRYLSPILLEGNRVVMARTSRKGER